MARGIAGHAAAVRGEAVWVMGGSHWVAESKVKSIAEEVQRRLPGADRWETVATIPGGFAHGGWADDGEALWLAGGLDRRGPTKAIWRIDLGRGTVALTGELPEARAYCGAAVLAGALWVLGGTPVDGDFTRTSSHVWRVDLVTQAVEKLPLPGPASINPLVLTLKGELHVLPGSVWSSEKHQLEAPTEAWIFSPVTRAWRQRPLSRVLPRGLTGVAVDAGLALLAGGAERREGATLLSAGTWLYDACDGMLVPQPSLPEPRLAAAAVLSDAGVLVLGGESGPGQRAATIWRLPAVGSGKR